MAVGLLRQQGRDSGYGGGVPFLLSADSAGSSDSADERLRLPSTLATDWPLVHHSGLAQSVLPVVKALRPVSNASTARRFQ